jgi:choline dehydrogenase-like flavoprotein
MRIPSAAAHLEIALSNDRSTEEYDAIIVGSGPAGATVARELSKRNKKVLILERGAEAPLKESARSMAAVLNGVSLGDGLAVARAFTAGGTTAVYFAVADPPPLEAFRSIPIDLGPALEEARQELPLTVLPDELLGPQAQRVRESAAQLGCPWKKNTMLVDLAKCRNGYTYEAKWNARAFLTDAVVRGAKLITRARVRKVLVEDRRAVGVEYELRVGKRAPEIRQGYSAKTILAAGSAASPVILRESGIRNLGSHGFYCHPNFVVIGAVPGLRARPHFVASMVADLEDDLALGDANFVAPIFRASMLAHGRFLRAFNHRSSIAVGVMVKDGLGGCLREDGRYHKELSKDVLLRLEKGEQMAQRIVRNAGGKRLFTSKITSAHLGGLLRINEQVDQELETECRDLHVCDGSVIPETVKGPPTLTLICLAKYLAGVLSI